MKYQYIPFCWPLWISAFITLSLGLFTMAKRQNAKGAISFIISMFIVTVWSSGNALEMLGADLATKLFWANVQYFAYCYSPVSLLSLCMEYTGLDSWVRNKKIFWLCVIPTIVVILVWTDGAHGLVRSNMHLDYSGLFPVIGKKYGPVFYFHAAYSYLLDFIAWELLVSAAFFKKSIYRKQAFSLLMGLSFIMFPSLIYVLKLIPSYQFDVTPVFFGPAGLIAAWGLFRYRLFDIVPMAWATVLRVMDTGVMILDNQERVLDANPAFEKIVGLDACAIVTKPIREVCAQIPGFADAWDKPDIDRFEFSICKDAVQKTYATVFSPILSDDGVPVGRLVILYDDTEKTRAQEMLLKQQWQLAVNEEREKMARDLHDNLGQVLGFINLQAQGICQELENSGVDMVTKRLDRLVDATQSAHTDLRKYIRSIRDPEYREEDFLTALQKKASGFADQTGLAVKLKIPVEFNGGTISPNVRIQILSIVKEALNNIRKHAEAKNVEILISLEQKKLCVIVKDDGKGFYALHSSDSSKTKFGLTIMRERAAEIGGTLKIESAPGKGCAITLNAPIENGDDDNETDACG
ncbi:sensor histidine kinase [Caproiciproducens faecalis]|uniref:histidine kinase n=1 Tax=Caproiciproducens faecalis TaxID=2820301 RepID=A0ABS7DNK4_9FIRM|nr:histidine kinase N-terminal 7TM domain-containing protein [Caproiciproducens faecalis]MBW7572390.1 PAS domain-containing protein [Caproiciproducens faecalis]